MKKWMIMILVLMATLLYFGAAMADSTLTVTGNGEIFVPADTAIISLGVQARDSDVLKAQSQANRVIASIRTKLVENGIDEKDINTDIINIYATYDYVMDGTERITGYNANSTLAIRITDLTMVGQVIDLAFGAGANTLNGVSFSASDSLAAEEEALEAAVKDASRKAEILAEAAGGKLGRIVSVTETGTYAYENGINNFRMEKEMAAGTDDTVVQASRICVTGNVTMVFEIE